jgi:UDP-N-acetylglucosamine--N-acetylmuramyl-(pentapeptide) pyrophosphoryl-undecaprenol N-acetylglucosamine transferase
MSAAPRLVFACGGTGGHIFPAFSVAEEIRRRNPRAEIVYVCGKKDIESAIFGMVKGERVVSVESAPFRGGASLFSLSFLLKLFSGFSQSFALMHREKPDLVIGFGGHVSFPVVLSAKLLGVRTMLHEQNVVPGSANRHLARVVDGVALSFKETRGRLPANKNMRVTGNPIRSAIERDCRDEALRYFGFDPGRPTVLVTGGSQGAESINGLFLGAAATLPEELRQRLQVLHLCGRMAVSEAEAVYRDLGIRAKVYSFFDRMDLAYAVSDAAVGRAGATFLAEILAKGIPAILIPYPYGDGHQRENARVFREMSCAVVAEQNLLTAQKLGELVKERFEQSRVSRTASVPTRSRGLLADFILTEASR